MLRRSEERRLDQQLAVLHFQYPVRLFRHIRRVRHHDEGLVLFACERCEQIQNLDARLGIEVARRLVRQNQVGVSAERARDGDALLFPARQFVGKHLAPVQQAHRFEQIVCPVARLRLLPPCQFGGHQYILAHRERGNEIEKLKYKADMFAAEQCSVVVIQRGDIRSADINVTPGGEVETREQIEQGALATAAPSDDGDEFAPGDGGIYALQDRAFLLAFVKRLGDIYKSNQCVVDAGLICHSGSLCEILNHCSLTLCGDQFAFLTRYEGAAERHLRVRAQRVRRGAGALTPFSGLSRICHVDTPALLRTKYTLPPLRPSVIARPRLLEKLDRARRKPLTIVTAAAGFGKTTLVREWCGGQSAPCAWFALDADDNDPARFLAYVIAALQTAQPAFGPNLPAQLQAAPVSPQVVLTSIINALSADNAELFLVLDDYHWIENEALHTALEFWIEHLPANLHVLVTSRIDPPWGLARWRARDRLSELRVSDLRWTPEEAAQFLNEGMSLALTGVQVEKLQARTEGWIAGLQLAALALAERENAGEFIESFSGTQRYIISYLAEEVLQRQPAAIGSFLLQTAILERFNAELCAAVTGVNDAHARLAELFKRNLFLIPLDEQDEWHRYHYLFAEVLRTRLKQTQGTEAIRQLHQRASEWFETKQLTGEAIRHALDAQDWARAARLIADHAETFWRRGEMATLERRLDAFPPAVLENDPRLLLTQAMTLILTAPSQFARIDTLIERAQTLPPPDGVDSHELRARLLAVAGANASNQGIPARTIALAQQALSDLSPTSLFWRMLTQTNLGIAYLTQGAPVSAAAALEQVIRLARHSDILYPGIFARMHLGHARMMQGQLRAAQAIFSGALADAQANYLDPSPAAGYLYGGYGKLLCQWNELAQSREMLARARERIDPQMRPWVLAEIETDVAQVALAQGDRAQARAALERAGELVQDARLELMRPGLHAFRAGVALRQGDLVQAVEWARGTGLSWRDEPSFAREYEYLTFARVLTAQGQTEEARKLTERLKVAARREGRDAVVIQAEILDAMAWTRAGKQAQAQSSLERAMELADADNFVRAFVDEGEAMRRLLAVERERGTDARLREYAARLLDAFGDKGTVAPPASEVRMQKSTPLFEPLSERELQVLRLIAAGASNPEIAERLVIALPTVKRHISTLYAKLGVTTRTQAIVRAQEFRLL